MRYEILKNFKDRNALSSDVLNESKEFDVIWIGPENSLSRHFFSLLKKEQKTEQTYCWIKTEGLIGDSLDEQWRALDFLGQSSENWDFFFFKEKQFYSFSSKIKRQKLSEIEEFYLNSRSVIDFLELEQASETSIDNDVIRSIGRRDDLESWTVELSSGKSITGKKLIWGVDSKKSLTDLIDFEHWNKETYESLRSEKEMTLIRLVFEEKESFDVFKKNSTYFVPLYNSKEEGHLLVERSSESEIVVWTFLEEENDNDKIKQMIKHMKRRLTLVLGSKKNIGKEKVKVVSVPISKNKVIDQSTYTLPKNIDLFDHPLQFYKNVNLDEIQSHYQRNLRIQ